MATQGEGHDLSVEETQAYHAADITIGVQPKGGGSADPGGVVTCFTRLVEQRLLHGRTTKN